MLTLRQLEVRRKAGGHEIQDSLVGAPPPGRRTLSTAGFRGFHHQPHVGRHRKHLGPS